MSDVGSPKPCEILLCEINDLQRTLPTRHRTPALLNEIRDKIIRYRDECDPIHGRYQLIRFGHVYGQARPPDTVRALQELLETPDLADQHRASAYGLLAMVTFRAVPDEENATYRQLAVEAARRAGATVREAILLINWTAALLMLDREAEAEAKYQEAIRVFEKLGAAEKDDQVREAHCRLLGNKAKLALARAKRAESEEAAGLLAQGSSWYRQAVAEASDWDHIRVNILIEWAERLAEVAKAVGPRPLEEAKAVLQEAHRGLDAHPCVYCPAYFAYVEGLIHTIEADRRFAHDRAAALRLWQHASSKLATSVQGYEQAGHPAKQDSASLRESVERRLQMEARPRKIFLSHKGSDKDTVRKYHQVLKLLGFDPWLDEEEMPAGTNLNRGILKGMEESCAAVFFITPRYQDDRYIGAEIDKAYELKMERGDQFALVALVIPDGNGHTGKVPELLKKFVYAKVGSEFEGLHAIIRAIPIRLGTPVWPDQ